MMDSTNNLSHFHCFSFVSFATFPSFFQIIQKQTVWQTKYIHTHTYHIYEHKTSSCYFDKQQKVSRNHNPERNKPKTITFHLSTQWHMCHFISTYFFPPLDLTLSSNSIFRSLHHRKLPSFRLLFFCSKKLLFYSQVSNFLNFVYAFISSKSFFFCSVRSVF